MKKDSFPILLLIIAIMAIMLLFQKNETTGVSTVHSYTTRKGKFVKSHGRRKISTSPDAAIRRSKSRYYYQTHKHIMRRRKHSD